MNQYNNPKDIFRQTQYGIWGVPYHEHNRQDSPPVNIKNLEGWFTQNNQIALRVQGTSVVNVFGGPAPIGGTITLFSTVSHGTAGTVVLWGTTAGTISTILSSGTAGVYVGSPSNVSAAVMKGDTVKITPTGGTMTCLVDFAFLP